MMSSTRSTATSGFSLIELLIAITILVGLVGATYSLFKSQSESFRQNTTRFDLVQNARGSIEATERVIRTTGAGVSGDQPMLVYGSDNVIAINTDYAERDTVDMRWAAYWNPDAVLSETIAWDAAASTTIPNSSPAYSYPSVTYQLGNGTVSPAESWMFYFELDGSTTRSDDYILRQRINAGTPEIVARNILPANGGKPFFSYLLERQLPTGDTMFTASGSLLPLIRRTLTSGISTSDSAAYVRPDSVRAVQMHYRVTNGKTAAEERMREVSTTIELPNNGVAMPTVCGRPPIAPGALVATEVGSLQGRVKLDWTRSADQDAGEVDVRQYLVWRRLTSVADLGPPLLVLRAETGVANYTTEFTDNIQGESYEFAIAAQDCTPSFSTNITTTLTLSGP